MTLDDLVSTDTLCIMCSPRRELCCWMTWRAISARPYCEVPCEVCNELYGSCEYDGTDGAGTAIYRPPRHPAHYEPSFIELNGYHRVVLLLHWLLAE